MPKTINPFDDPSRAKPSSMLPDETKKEERARRQQEQAGLRAFIQARVIEKDRPMDEPAMELGDEYASGMEAHPLLADLQHLDGVDNNPPDPGLSPAAKEKFKEAKRKQQAEKELKLELNPNLQHRHTHTPRFNPKPGGP